MAEDRDILAEITRDEQWLAGLLEATPGPSPAAVDRVRQAAAVEGERAVMDRFEDPAPDPTTVERVRQAVRSELRRGRFPVWSGRTRRIYAALSAAACLMVAVGVVRFVVPMHLAKRGDSGAAGAPRHPAVAEAASTEQIVEDMTVAFQSAWERRDRSLLILADEVSRVSLGSSDLEIDTVDAELETIGDEIRGLLSERPQPWET